MDNIPQIYRSVIDSLVENCHHGQGQVMSARVRSGVWNVNRAELIGEQQTRFNELLGRLSAADRGSVAEMLELAFEGGVFETLKSLEAAEIKPFREGYEGCPYEDFIGRLNGWEWPSA